ncbi:hypothetical protein [Myroides marinus]|uniref:Uncharacterized protein n=1 Tax=Myroides marinus TaxID=703342 RepID=A0A1H6TX26_9FLAO|nr:hypothetical protein [Myroides marinus]MDM1380052.1 hypothetical protein [Myroides marinus]MDM1387291.1 hypothetical protein [Myroides marinus]MDM1394536.1 hypothetical protein [Myroides marinus]SEI80302.1 hypothetical protein SAMN04488018_10511 [Myroides marinus]
MKDKNELKNIEKYRKEISHKTDRELLEEKAYFTFATYRVTEKIYLILYIWFILSFIGILCAILTIFIIGKQ